jgi:hypothetical protein
MSEDTNIEPGENGLLDNVQLEDPNANKEVNPSATEVDHKAAPPGEPKPEGPKDRPEFLPENFWKDGKADYESLAKSWKDLRAKISKGEHNAPADGKYKLEAFGEGYDDQNPIAGTLTSWAKENGLSQAQFDDLAGKLSSQARELMQGESIDPAEELKALGPNGNAIVNGMVDWARGMVNKEILSKEDFEEFKIMGGTARGINVLMKIRSAYEGRMPIDPAPLEEGMNRNKLEEYIKDPRWNSDPNWRQSREREWFSSQR